MVKKDDVSIKEVLRIFLSVEPSTFRKKVFEDLNKENLHRVLSANSPTDIREEVCNLMRNEYGLQDREIDHNILPFVRPLQIMLGKMYSFSNEVFKDSKPGKIYIKQGKIKGAIFRIYMFHFVRMFISIYDSLQPTKEGNCE